MPSSAVSPSVSIEQSSAGGRSFLPLGLFAIALGALWFVVCKHLSAEWSYNEQYNYGWFVPFFALYLFWLRWEDRPPPEIRDQRSEVSSEIRHSSFVIRHSIALAIAVPALLLLLPVRLIEVANPDWRPVSWVHALAVVMLTLLMIWEAGGKPWLRHFAFPIVFTLVAVPWLSAIEEPIIQGLMPTVASLATETISLFGIPAEVQGNLIRVNGGMVGVNEACSGVRSLQTSIMLGLLFGELRRLSIWRRAVLVVAAVGIAFVANCGRAFFLVWIAATRGIPQVEHWHNTAGYTIVALVFFGCLGLATWLSPSQKSEVSSQRADGSDQKSTVSAESSSFVIRRSSLFRLSIFVLCWIVLVEAGVELWYRAHEQNLRPSAQWSVRWPESAPEFRDVPIDERARGILHHDEGRGASWREPVQLNNFATATIGRPTCLLYFFRWRPGHNSALLANAHRPDVCLPATGWRQTGDYKVHDYDVAPNFAIPFRHFEFRNDNSGRKQVAHAFYCVWEDRVPRNDSESAARGMSGEPSAWTRSERIAAVLSGRRHLGQQVMEYLIVQPREVSAAEAEQAFANSIRELVSTVPAQPN